MEPSGWYLPPSVLLSGSHSMYQACASSRRGTFPPEAASSLLVTRQWSDTSVVDTFRLL